MTIDQVIALAASVGACLSAIAAFFAVRQSSIHSKASYKPELVIARTLFECEAKDSIPYEWINREDEKEEADLRRMFSVPLRNVGLGAAKQVSISWSFPIEKMVETVNKMAQKSLIPAYFEYERGALSLKSEKLAQHTSFWSNQQKETIDFVLPAPVDESPVRLVVPLAFTQLVSALVYFAAKADDFDSFPEIPLLKVEMSYFDIGGSKHSCGFNLEANISMVMNKGEGMNGYIESRRSA